MNTARTITLAALLGLSADAARPISMSYGSPSNCGFAPVERVVSYLMGDPFSCVGASGDRIEWSGDGKRIELRVQPFSEVLREFAALREDPRVEITPERVLRYSAGRYLFDPGTEATMLTVVQRCGWHDGDAVREGGYALRIDLYDADRPLATLLDVGARNGLTRAETPYCEQLHVVNRDSSSADAPVSWRKAENTLEYGNIDAAVQYADGTPALTPANDFWRSIRERAVAAAYGRILEEADSVGAWSTVLKRE